MDVIFNEGGNTTTVALPWTGDLSTDRNSVEAMRYCQTLFVIWQQPRFLNYHHIMNLKKILKFRAVKLNAQRSLYIPRDN
jgi:hypothetical protein